jgi:Tfp pilus assembly protein PilZ
MGEDGAMRKIVERRENGRFKCNRAALHNTDADDLFFRGEVCNYSKRGLYFESNVDLQSGDNISILIEKQSSEGTQLVDVKIVWCKELQGSSFDRGYGATLQERRDIDYIKNKIKGERHYDK